MKFLTRGLGLVLLAPLCLAAGTGCAASAPGSNVGAPGKAAKDEDRDPRLLFERGKAFAEVNDVVRAEQYFAAALAAGADEREVIPHLLRVCVAAKHHRLAVDYAEAALARHPRDARLRFLTGALHATIGDRERARRHLEVAGKALERDPEVQFAVGVFFRDEAGDRVKADPYFREYLRIAPSGVHRDEAQASLLETIER